MYLTLTYPVQSGGRFFTRGNVRGYCFGFNVPMAIGKEKVDEVYGDANAYDFGARIYDPRLGRWLSLDKMFYEAPGWSPYRAFFNNPLYWTDFDGNIEWPLNGTQAANKKDAPKGGWGMENTVIRTSTYRDTDRPPGTTNPHIGIDYRAAVGTPFYSLGDGKVSAIGETRKGAKYITVEYSNGDQVRFLHIDKIADGLVVGSAVKEGQPLGETGSTGTVNPHLHVDAVNKNGVQIDPEATNYGKLTNEEFFGKYGGDYSKVPANNTIQLSELVAQYNNLIKNQRDLDRVSKNPNLPYLTQELQRIVDYLQTDLKSKFESIKSGDTKVVK